MNPNLFWKFIGRYVSKDLKLTLHNHCCTSDFSVWRSVTSTIKWCFMMGSVSYLLKAQFPLSEASPFIDCCNSDFSIWRSVYSVMKWCLMMGSVSYLLKGQFTTFVTKAFFWQFIGRCVSKDLKLALHNRCCNSDSSIWRSAYSVMQWCLMMGPVSNT